VAILEKNYTRGTGPKVRSSGGVKTASLPIVAEIVVNRACVMLATLTSKNGNTKSIKAEVHYSPSDCLYGAFRRPKAKGHHSMALAGLSSIFGIGGGIEAIAGLFAKLKEVLTKESQREENRERLRAAIRVLDTLETSLKQGEEIGKSIGKLIEEAKDPPTRNDSERLYSKLADFFDHLRSFHELYIELCRESKVISQFEFIDRLHKTDPEISEMVVFLGKCYDNGKVDVRDLPTFISLYGPRRKNYHKISNLIDEKLKEHDSVLVKTKRIAPKLLLPTRATQRQLMRSLIALAKQKDTFVKLDNKVADQLLEQSPDWMSSLSELMKDAKERFERIISVSRPYAPRKRDSNLNIWPPR
jgi:hypothetical protein